MIDIDEYIEMWNDHLLGSQGCADLTNALIAEVKRLRELNILLCDYLLDFHNGTPLDSEWPHILTLIRGEEG